jgi:hypothetical protein
VTGGIRDTPLGDRAAAERPPGGAAGPPGEPWSSSVRARDGAAGGQRAPAVDARRRILAMPDLESRHYLQAWHALRALGVPPAPADARP